MKITVICKKEVVYKNGTSPLFVRFIHNKSKKLVSLGVAVSPQFWVSKAQILTPDCSERKVIQSKIDVAVEAYNKQIRRLEALNIEPTIEALFGERKQGVSYTVEEYFERVIKGLDDRSKHNILHPSIKAR